MLNDLYSCQQSCILDVDSTLPSVCSIVKFIQGPLKTWVQNITGRVFSNKMTITASQYKFTDRLLCHDDNLHDRSVAFILYLCKDWKKQYGGSLDLFDCDSDNQPKTVVKSIFPTYGSFAFFEVSHNSYHQVAEVLTSKSIRLSINGWYHGEDLPQQAVWQGTIPKLLAPIPLRGKSVDDFVDDTWLNMKTCVQVKSAFEKDLCVSLPKFLKSSVFKGIETALKDSSIVWESCGPANRKRYDVARLSSLPETLTRFLKFIQSKDWFRYLSECTVEISPDVKPLPKCWFEVQRWQPGDYTVLVDNDPLNTSTGLDVHLYFGVEKRPKNNVGGEVFYLGPDRDDDDNLEQAFHLEPENNTSTIIAHIEGMAVLTKYLDHRNKPFFKIFGRYSQSVE
ncbi:Prolyl 3-hydroxylase OGFOD1 [Frankliniella fusca]|uniref:uS12 prolyl 3-hydroxylase n=1 Tax=Frankliniella fusca TaxID=407009 RepID=A0AAE1H089_9NEOP|nr:Prolyl 3-hydroxylase OGFOD1 [Frankliniella fusca]